MKPSTPSQRGEFDSSKTNQPWATACIQVPVLERNAPDQKSRKLRCRSARNIPPTLRLRSGSTLTSVDISILDTMSPAFSKAERECAGRSFRFVFDLFPCLWTQPKGLTLNTRSHGSEFHL